MNESITLSGQTRFERNGTDEMLHQTTIAITPGQVMTTLAGFGEGCASHDPVTSAQPAVERYLRVVDRAMQVTAYRNRPIQPRWKPEKRRRRARQQAS